MKTSLIAGKPKFLMDMVISSEASVEERSTTIETTYKRKGVEYTQASGNGRGP